MAKKKIKDQPTYIENISTEAMDSIMDSRTALYAKDVIQDRAIPDLRDGLKPVQRRIIYSMYRSNYTFEHATRKCAGIVGDVMGKFHPHGDSSIYEALVRMSQDWKMSVPLIKFQGNNGSIDNDPAAAYRYTEAKLNEFSNFLINEIDKNTVEMTLNFDDTLFEPTVLPARFPNLFVNGGSGIAFAIATEIPPHNLKEMCDAVIHRINHPSCSLNDLLNIIQGPDFPTGGIVFKGQGLRDIYETGKGKIEIMSHIITDTSNKDFNRLTIDNIPYGVVKKDLVYSIDKIKKSKEIDGIIDVIDESAGDEIKITVDLKKEVNPDIVIKYLTSKTELRINYNANIVAISKKAPKLLNLTTYLDDFIEFQTELILRKSKFDLQKAEDRLHIVEGLIKAINVVNDVIKIIRSSKDKEDSKNNLKTKYSFSDVQAEAIVMMRLYRLSNADVNTYIEEKNNLEKVIADLKETISTPLKVKHIIVDDLKDIAKKFGVERKTKIVEPDESFDKSSIDKRSLILKEDCYVTITKEGYINRSSVKSHDASNGDLPKTKEEDIIVMTSLCNTLDYVLCFTNKGNYIFIPVCEIEEGKYKDFGKHVNYLCTLPFDEEIIRCIIVRDFNIDVTIGLVSKSGQIKKSRLCDFFVQRHSKPIGCFKLSRDDELVDAKVLNGNNNLLIITEAGKISYFNENEFSASGLRSSGVKAISTLKNSFVKGFENFKENEKSKLLFITNNKMCRVYENSYAELTKRLGKTQDAFKSFKSDIHSLIYVEKIDKKKEFIDLTLLMSDKSLINFKFDDYSLTPVEKYCKENMALPKSLKIVNVFINNVEIIDENTIIEDHPDYSKSEQDDNNGKDGKNEYEQISIFDSMGD